jgi:hypothetical protein
MLTRYSVDESRRVIFVRTWDFCLLYYPPRPFLQRSICFCTISLLALPDQSRVTSRSLDMIYEMWNHYATQTKSKH